MVYVPDKENYECFVVQNDSTIRAYEEVPKNNTDISYRDYYYTANYLYRDGVQSFGSYTSLPVCLDMSSVSSSVYYRNDFDKILLIFLILSIFCFYIPLKIFLRFFRRFN